MRLVILTGGELRHDFVRMALALSPGLEVLATFCEGTEGTLVARTDDPAVAAHARARAASEQDFFGAFVRLAPDRSSPRAIARGAVNDPAVVQAILDLRPDVVAAYGCSLVRGPLLEAFAGRFANVHLGLSPWYRGAGTNVWALLDGRPECVGATIMHIDAGVDTGEIIHQVRARLLPGDTPHQVGNRLIADMVPAYAAVLAGWNELARMPQPAIPPDVRVCRNRDFGVEAVERLYAMFAGGLVERHLGAADHRERAIPLVQQPLVTRALGA